MADSKQKKILDAAVVRIKALAISWVPDANVGILKVEETGKFNLEPPAAAVFGIPTERISQSEGDNVSHVVYYPLMVLIRRSTLTDQGAPDETSQDAVFLAREQIREQLWEKPAQLIAAGAPDTVCDIEWQPGPILDAGKINQTQVWQSRLQFWVKSKEIRTND